MPAHITQRHRVNKVIDFVRDCDAGLLSLEDLADVACWSRFHFSRVFSEVCHESPVEFVSRIRLEQSVSNLIYRPDLPVTTIALEAGYASSQAFSNAFRRRYRISPTQFRHRNAWYADDFPENQYALSPIMSKVLAQTQQTSQRFQIVLRTMPATRLAYIRNRGAYYNSTRGRRAQLIRLITWAKARGVWCEGTPVIGVCPDSSSVTPPQYCQYDFGFAVEDGVDEDDDLSIQHLPETRLATLIVVGPAPVGRYAWRWFLSRWFPQSGLFPTGNIFYEAFYPDMSALGTQRMKVMLCVPLASFNSKAAKFAPASQWPPEL